MEKAQIILDTEKYETYINEIEEALKEYKECVKELKAYSAEDSRQGWDRAILRCR